MTPNEFDLLTALSMKAGRVVAYDWLPERVWSLGMPGLSGIFTPSFKIQNANEFEAAIERAAAASGRAVVAAAGPGGGSSCAR